MPETPKPPSDEEVLKMHEEAHKAQAKALVSHIVPEQDRSPYRYYVVGIGGVREGYLDEFSNEELASLKERDPDLHAGVIKAAKEFEGKHPKPAEPKEPKEPETSVTPQEHKEIPPKVHKNAGE